MNNFSPNLSDRLLIGIVVGVVLVLGLAVLLASVGGEDEDLEQAQEITLDAQLKPFWDIPLPEEHDVVDPGEPRRKNLLYLDISHSMGGFIPPPGADVEPGFRSAAQLVPGHLVRAYRGTVRWTGVAAGLERMGQETPLFDRGLFTGDRSLLDRAIHDLSEELRAGRATTAALITDLIANGGPEGAMGAAEDLLWWAGSRAVREGWYELGILGVRAPYWGVTTTSNRCVPTHPPLGCWYSEYLNSYRPLSAKVERPFYVVFVARRDMERPEASRLDAMGTELAEAFQAEGLEAQWQLLTAGVLPRQAEVRCTVTKAEDGRRQYALFRNEEGQWKCRRSEPVALGCRVTPEEWIGPLTEAEANWPGVETRADGRQLALTLDCARYRDEDDHPAEALRWHRVTARPPAVELHNPWVDWSSRSDEGQEDLTRTLQVALLVEALQPEPKHVEVEILEPVLAGRDSPSEESTDAR